MPKETDQLEGRPNQETKEFIIIPKDELKERIIREWLARIAYEYKDYVQECIDDKEVKDHQWDWYDIEDDLVKRLKNEGVSIEEIAVFVGGKKVSD